MMRNIFCLMVGLAAMLVLVVSCASAPVVTPTPVASDTPLPTATISAKQVGYLEGKVTVGPLRPGPVRADSPPPPVAPEVYTTRSIDIFQADGKTLVMNVKFKDDGTYRVELAPGIYVIALARTGIDRARDLPKTITIESGKTVKLDIDIDTGMR